MKLLKNTLLIVALFAVDSVAARGGVATSSGSSSSQPAPQPKAIPAPTAAPKGSYQSLLQKIRTMSPSSEVISVDGIFTPNFINLVKSSNLKPELMRPLFEAGRSLHAILSGDNDEDLQLLTSIDKQIEAIVEKISAMPIQSKAKKALPSIPNYDALGDAIKKLVLNSEALLTTELINGENIKLDAVSKIMQALFSDFSKVPKAELLAKLFDCIDKYILKDKVNDKKKQELKFFITDMDNQNKKPGQEIVNEDNLANLISSAKNMIDQAVSNGGLLEKLFPQRGEALQNSQWFNDNITKKLRQEFPNISDVDSFVAAICTPLLLLAKTKMNFNNISIQTLKDFVRASVDDAFNQGNPRQQELKLSTKKPTQPGQEPAQKNVQNISYQEKNDWPALMQALETTNTDNPTTAGQTLAIAIKQDLSKNHVPFNSSFHVIEKIYLNKDIPKDTIKQIVSAINEAMTVKRVIPQNKTPEDTIDSYIEKLVGHYKGSLRSDLTLYSVIQKNTIATLVDPLKNEVKDRSIKITNQEMRTKLSDAILGLNTIHLDQYQIKELGKSLLELLPNQN